MLRIRRAEEIHHEAGGWFDARWHSSFEVPVEFRPVGVWAG